jgi:nucleoside-triphosphatase THEP1
MKTIVLDEVDKLKEKFHKLENQVSKIIKENQTLTAKVNNLETIIEKCKQSAKIFCTPEIITKQ